MVPGLDVGLHAGRGEFLQKDAAFRLQTDVDDGEFIGEPDDPSGDDGPIEASIPAEGFVEQRGEIFAHEMVLRGLRGPDCGG